ncbi:hypothetical protein HDA32_001159 [Spinactinospora alkalitolerans]|uniref:DUF2786 domain-containing protein n=1 Tax=Spinactinospora alkalitolerans TaxID=687207 RepID=A0A852TPX6_9ACTN|nr:DUF2786 domain-containing protein [Spinactinospora alkalitolerans]NYE46039.1 hypothetical protein [Spinactinospora alkalitolerans]
MGEAGRHGDSVDELIAGALAALGRRDGAGFRWRADQLVARPDEAARGAVDRALFSRLVVTVGYAWHNGWQPAELVRHVRRESGTGADDGAVHGRVAADAVAAQMRRYDAATVDERWEAQLAALDARVWWASDDDYVREWSVREGARRAEWVEYALEALHVLSALPPLAPLCPPPGRARRSPAAEPTRRAPVEQRMLDRVRALLAKAESTEFPRESEALTARAQELMARHSIDHALLAAEAGDDGDGPAGRRVPVDDPYPESKAVLLDAVAEANRCRAVWDQRLGLSTVIGFAEDADAVELLFTSLLVQATTAMTKAEAAQRTKGRKRTRTFRRSFLHSFAQRIGERLAGAADSAAKQAAAESAGRDLLPVLAVRERAVEAAAEEMFPETVRSRVRGVHDREGWISGRDAADATPLRGR